ncbi:MAG: T9SS type A sorting domain-containing protein [Bacteroidetes bacterium]|nr:T9SS type A sorting domain-containing protein [Bacteroidota bacterium]
MKFLRLFLLPFAVVLILLSSTMVDVASAGPGDTLVVQTFTWTSPLIGGAREGRFDFPTVGKEWERVLMYYKLKCDPSQNPACGEWDYLTYARLFEHTGLYDSTQATHPNFIVFGTTPDTLGYMTSPSWSFVPRIEKRVVYDDTTSLNETTVGSGSMALGITPLSASRDFRTYIIWTSEELAAAGLKAEAITAMRFQVGDVDGGLHRLTLRLRRYTGDGWDNTIPLRDVGFATVFDGAMTLTPNSWNTIHFTDAFTYWSGDILAELSVDRIDGTGFTVIGDMTQDALMFTSMDADEYLHFQPRSYVDCGPMSELNDTQAFTFEAWFNPASLQNWTNIVMKSAANENRVGIQLNPPDAGKSDVYCLVGNGENSYGRTSNRPISTNTWVHVAMVYDGTINTQDGRLVLYLNGEKQTLTFNGTVPAFTSSNNATFQIASSGGSFFEGGIDEVRVWSAALTQEQVLERMQSRLAASDPLYGSVISAWNFDEGSGTVAYDLKGAHDGRLLFPQRKDWRGQRARGFLAANYRPNVVFEQGSFTSHLEQTLAVDTLENPGLMVVLYGDTTRANVPTDTMYVWPTYSTYTFDENGQVVSSTPVPADGWLYRENHFYYQNPFEIVNRYELGRFITPYGIGMDLGEGWTWVYDVTDFLPLLKDSVHLSAGNFQELLDMKFIFIEGTPPRDVMKVQNLWQGTYSLKNFDTQVPPRTIDLDPAASMFKLRTTVTGHDFSNATNCAEFCPKIHSVKVNDQEKWNWQIIQECSTNPLYPQGGTWIYARAGWCPGMEGKTQEFELTPFITGSSVKLDYESDYDEFGRYVMDSQLISYGPPNHKVDAAVEAIIAPSGNELYRRFNPTCGQPRIVIQNRGETELSGLDIIYGPRGGSSNTYRWTGRLAFMEKETVDLPAFDWGEWGPDNVFDVRVSNPSGGADEYAYNDTQFSSFATVPTFDDALIFRFRTNNAPQENRWELRDADQRLIMSRSGFSANTLYIDTLDLLPGCYRLTLFDSGEDGISWWANNDGTGYFQIRIVDGNMWESLNPDFGKMASYSFRYSNLVSVGDVADAAEGFDLYPNPATDRVTLRYELPAAAAVHYEVYNLLGERVRAGAEREFPQGIYTEEISTAGLQPGNYVVFIAEGAQVLRRMKLNVVR